ncbi:hypothetical protein H4R33_005195 [Dimargaris cristalligena]|uniref:Uncharacterized protein n=1 Tax=Dimargaris cristalligena TaxID=215637 RepID=A0A4P9ZU29_9FUNG|nr:hypothetical protein H4R33_005195 [Dimargaris cristalligena]RKP36728.1 hypothetical protein BJ085DRAFT_41198 [Dimargaris cristalligena]|eukprot:RKP36728.1 hypothetical protein BJ085DRAFT_41198 [Dimargaris cristalligena]
MWTATNMAGPIQMILPTILTLAILVLCSPVLLPLCLFIVACGVVSTLLALGVLAMWVLAAAARLAWLALTDLLNWAWLMVQRLLLDIQQAVALGVAMVSRRRNLVWSFRKQKASDQGPPPPNAP